MDRLFRGGRPLWSWGLRLGIMAVIGLPVFAQEAETRGAADANDDHASPPKQESKITFVGRGGSTVKITHEGGHVEEVTAEDAEITIVPEPAETEASEESAASEPVSESELTVVGQGGPDIRVVRENGPVEEIAGEDPNPTAAAPVATVENTPPPPGPRGARGSRSRQPPRAEEDTGTEHSGETP